MGSLRFRVYRFPAAKSKLQAVPEALPVLQLHGQQAESLMLLLMWKL